MSAKRFDIGRQYQGSIGAPAITEQPGGRYVLASDYDALVEQLEAVGAGGVSLMGARQATDEAGFTLGPVSDGGLDPRNSHIDPARDDEEQPWL